MLSVAAQQAQEVLLQDVGYDWGTLKLGGAAHPIIHNLHSSAAMLAANMSDCLPSGCSSGNPILASCNRLFA